MEEIKRHKAERQRGSADPAHFIREADCGICR